MSQNDKRKLYKTILNEYFFNKSSFFKYQVNLIYYTKPNFGDAMTCDIVNFMLNLKGFDLHSKTKKKYVFLSSLGSLIDCKRFFKKTIWGTGSLTNDNPYPKYSHLFFRGDIRCVRGPLTEEILVKNHVINHKIGIYGDPGILIPMFYKPSVKKKFKVSIIPHFKDVINSDYHTIDVKTNDWKKVIDEILASELIVSSSLHGIIVAEAYGIPAIWLHNENSNQSKHKYLDYYYSTNRMNPICVSSIEEALKISNIENPNLNVLRNNLINSFPYDLWIKRK